MACKSTLLTGMQCPAVKSDGRADLQPCNIELWTDMLLQSTLDNIAYRLTRFQGHKETLQKCKPHGFLNLLHVRLVAWSDEFAYQEKPNEPVQM